MFARRGRVGPRQHALVAGSPAGRHVRRHFANRVACCPPRSIRYAGREGCGERTWLR